MSTPQNNFREALEARRRAIFPDQDQEEEEVLIGIENSFSRELVKRTGGIRGREVAGFRRKVPDVGIMGAFGHGIKVGIFEPFKIIGAEVAEAELDETGEKAANLLGSFVGFGISFIPFMAGAGFALRGF